MRRAAFPFTDLQVALVKAHADYSHRTDFPIFECFTPDLSWLTKPIYSLLVMALLFRLVKTEDPTTLIGHTSLTRGTTHTSRTFMPPRARTGCCDNTAACHDTNTQFVPHSPASPSQRTDAHANFHDVSDASNTTSLD